MELKPNFYVIILAAGFATRLVPISNKIPKPLIEISGKSIISRIISNFYQAGFNKFCVVVGYKKELLIEEVLKIKKCEILIAEQKEISGMANAIKTAIIKVKQNQNNEEINNYFITAADIIFSKEEILKIYNLFRNSQADMILSLIKSNDTSIAKGHGNVKIAESSDLAKEFDCNQGLQIIDIIEKPKDRQILSKYYSLPLYIINQKIVRYLKTVRVSERGEKELQDAIKKAIEKGKNIRGIRIIKNWITSNDIGKYHLTNLEDIIKMNNRFLKGFNLRNSKGINMKYVEPINIKEDTKIQNNALLGPYTTIGKSCIIGDSSKISNSIIYDMVIVGKFCELEWCIIDENVELPESFRAKKCFITRSNGEELDIINF
ncbi:MAG: sugar phosphate nucleotidyltransferase [Promethearchaeota archaeon]